MRNRNLIILAVVLALLITISVVQKAGRNHAASQPDTEPVLNAEFAPEDVNRVVVARGEPDSSDVVIERLPDQWVLRNSWSHRADAKRIDALIEVLQDIRGEFRSDDPAVLADYGLGGDDALRVSIYGKDWQEVFSIEIGKKPSRGTGVFVRSPAGDAVFLTRADVLGRLGMYGGATDPKATHFMDLAVRETDRADIEAITTWIDGEATAIEKIYPQPEAAAGDTAIAPVDRSTWEWRITEPERRAAAKTKCDVVLGALAKVRAVDIDDPDADLRGYGLWRAAKRVEARMADGSVFEMRFGNEREASAGSPEGVYMMTSADRTVWVVRKGVVDQIFKKTEDLLPEE